MQHGDGRSALFVFPGVGGMVLELFDLGRLIHHRGPIYANLSRGLDGQQTPDRTVANMAAYQVGVVRKIQPHGPYCFLGFSLGGLVAIEVARLFLKEGETVAFLGLIEPNLPERVWPPSVKREFLYNRAKAHVSALSKLSTGDAIKYASARAKPLFNRLHRLVGFAAAASASPYHLDGLSMELAQVREARLAAFYAYELEDYQGKVVLFNSKDGDPLSCRPVKVFPKHVQEYESFTCSGDHATMVRMPHVQQLADQISTCLTKLDLD
jgi:thioesterase domain-containing protein